MSLDTYPVYKTGTENVGVQIIWTPADGPCAPPFSNKDIQTWLANEFTYQGRPVPYYGTACAETSTKSYYGNYGGTVKMRLVQYGAVPNGTALLGGFDLFKAYPGRTLRQPGNCGGDCEGPLSIYPGIGPKLYQLGTATFVVRTCTVSANDVFMNAVLKSQFQSATILETTPFQFNLSNFPAGLTSFTYRIDPLTPVIDAANGVFANETGTDKAQGVGLRLTNSAGTAAIRLDGTTYAVPSYSASTGGGASVPLNVSYFRTGSASDVQGGIVRGVAQLTLFYN
ncbi:type 1 fimbrial protein [Pseudomonas sp. PDNC002]|uniref:fimbrial protein n=1 Tax=Pseudomonas sp. PDNC002 TaxID=2811422 RepID=UPI001965EFDA|nr:type 1 fimbrial protein [Pseudomonas sp. PDNC002]QRY81236.1 type 1 fimbrial protein [Pseudomonas sp. PDNC002]